MRAIVVNRTGGLEELLPSEMPMPEAGPGQVLVRVHAAGVCYRDVLDRQGAYPMMKLPVVPGHEFAGEVVAVGPEVRGFAVDHRGASRFAIGDRVVNLHRAPCGSCRPCLEGQEMRCVGSPWAFGLTLDGGYAEYVMAPESALLHLPQRLAYRDSAFLNCTAAVALRALRTQGQMLSGETVLITGASGGVGIHAVQLARILGGWVIAVTSSENKAEALRQAGAHKVVVSRDGNFHRAVRAETDGGVDLGLELVGGPTWNGSLRSLRPGGRLVLLGNVLAQRVEVNLGYLIINEVSVTGSAMATRDDLRDVLSYVEQRMLRPVVDRSYPLEQAREAQRRLQERDVIGRIVLLPQGDSR